jgi:hypothetical protein
MARDGLPRVPIPGVPVQRGAGGAVRLVLPARIARGEMAEIAEIAAVRLDMLFGA